MSESGDREVRTGKPRVALVTIFDVETLGIRSIHAVLNSAGYPCDLIMFRDKRDQWGTWPSEKEYELLAGLLAERRPEVLGISFRSFALGIAERISAIAREKAQSLIVWGGSHPTLLPEECIQTADVVCVGEGEYPMLDLMKALSEDRPIGGIANLWVREGDQVHRNPLRPLLQDLDSLPFPVLGDDNKFLIDCDTLKREDVYLGGHRPGSYFIAASRGCPFHCDFCSNSAFFETYRGLGPYVRQRSPENVIGELERAKNNLDLQFVGFMDEVFSLDAEWTKKICALYKERIGLPFKCEVHPTTLSPELIAAMKDAGLQLAILGVQSGSDRSRRENYHRMTLNNDILSVARAMAKNKVMGFYDFIFDNPFETREDLSETLDLILQLPRPHNLEILSLAFFPRTKITERALVEGQITREQVEDRSRKTFANFWSSIDKSINTDNAFYSTLAWLSVIKMHPERMELIFLDNRYGESYHVIPKSLIRLISRSKFFYGHPRVLNKAMILGIRTVNILLIPVRKLRSGFRLLRRGKWREIFSRIDSLVKTS